MDVSETEWSQAGKTEGGLEAEGLMEPWRSRLVLHELKQVLTARARWLLSAVPGVFQLS